MIVHINIITRHIVRWHISVSPASPAYSVISVEIPTVCIPSVVPERVHVETDVYISETIKPTVIIVKLNAHPSVQPYHIIPDIVLLPYIVTAICHICIFFTFNSLQSFVKSIGLTTGKQTVVLSIRDSQTDVPVPVKLLIVEVSVVVISLTKGGSDSCHKHHQYCK